MGVNHIFSKMKRFLLIGVLCGAALASDYQYLDEVSSHSSSKYDTSNEYITSYEVDEDKYPSHRPVYRRYQPHHSTAYRPHQPHHSTAYRPHYQPRRTAYRYEAEHQPQYYTQPQYYQPPRTAYRYEVEYRPHYPQPQPHYDPRYARGYKTDVPVYGELYQPKPVSAPIIHRPKPFYLPKPNIVVAPLKPAKYEHSEPVYGPVDYYGGHQRTGYNSQPQYHPQPQYYTPQPQYYQPHYDLRYARGYKTDVPVYGELYQPKPVSAPIIKRTKPFYLPKPKIVVAPHKPKGYY